MEFSYAAEDGDEYDVGLYDTKERCVALEPCATMFICWSEEQIEACDIKNPQGKHERSMFINIKGEPLYPWQINKGFDIVEQIDENENTVVGFDVSKDNKVSSVRFNRGLVDNKGEFIIPAEYENIKYVSDRIYACTSNNQTWLVQV